MPRMCVAGSVSTWRERNSSRCFSWCFCLLVSSLLVPPGWPLSVVLVPLLMEEISDDSSELSNSKAPETQETKEMGWLSFDEEGGLMFLNSTTDTDTDHTAAPRFIQALHKISNPMHWQLFYSRIILLKILGFYGRENDFADIRN